MSSSSNIQTSSNSLSGYSLFNFQPGQESSTPPPQIINTRAAFRSRLTPVNTDTGPDDETSGFSTIASYNTEDIIVKTMNSSEHIITSTIAQARKENENVVEAAQEIIRDQVAFELHASCGLKLSDALEHVETHKDLDSEINAQLQLKGIFTAKEIESSKVTQIKIMDCLVPGPDRVDSGSLQRQFKNLSPEPEVEWLVEG